MIGKTTPRRGKTNALESSLENRWTHIQQLIDYGGEITLGAISRTNICAITASDEDQCLAMLQRREDETLFEMLDRLDVAIEHAWDNEEFIDEINPP